MEVGDLHCEAVWIVMRDSVPGVCAPGLSDVKTADAYEADIFGLVMAALTIAAVAAKVRVDKTKEKDETS